MALINCPECGKEISDKSNQCIHCGYPIKQKYISIVNGNKTDLSFLLDDSYDKLSKLKDLINIGNSSITYVKPIVDKIIETKQIPEVLNIPTQQSKYVESHKIKCPTCQSTNVKKIGTGERVISVSTLGLFSKKINKSFKCKNCGYTW